MELLAPAGNLEKLRWAVEYGADAVYFGTEFGSLRSYAGNFTFDEAETGLELLHERGKRGYVTLNIYPFSNEFEKLIATAKTLDEMEVDALICADMGVFSELKKLNLKAALHISTQANTTNYQAALAYKEMGAKRVNLARELSLEKIEEIQKQIKGRVETEVFIHGAVCFSYSGRCAISDYTTGHPANRGECKHPCRWKYALVEEERPGNYIPVYEDERGLYLFNCKELALFEYVSALKQMGIQSLKIEGRMKSIHYIASTVSFYRQVIDGKAFSQNEALELLNRIPNRGYSTGFMKGNIDESDYQWERSGSRSESKFVGNIKEEKIDNQSILEVRNKIFAGETLEILSSDGTLSTITLPSPLKIKDGTKADFANHTQYILLKKNLKPFTIFRRVG